MSSPDPNQLRGALARLLETDRILGVSAVPLDVAPLRAGRGSRAASRTAASGQRPTPSAPPPGTVAGSRVPAAPASPQPAPAAAAPRVSAERANPLQDITPDELQRRHDALRQLDETQVKGCPRCKLCDFRTQTVFGQGNPAARLVFIGEAPGYEEDKSGLAFVGRAGQLLTKMIEAMGLSRDEVFICNVLKCRPPDNRTPAPDEIAACWPYLERQLQIIKPEIIVTLGKPATQTLLRTTDSIGSLRGRWHQYALAPGSNDIVDVMPTYHPSYLLRTPGDKVKTWSDLKMVMQQMGLPLPGK